MVICGNLASEIALYPNPNSTLIQSTSTTDKGNTTNSLFVRSSSQPGLFYLPYTFVGASSPFPRVLSVVGFLPNKKIPSPPTLSRHLLVPSNATTTTTTNNTNNTTSPHLYAMLNECLKSERMSAIVLLAENWYAIINSITEKDKTGYPIESHHYQMKYIYVLYPH